METRTYTERSNARRAARAAGLDPDTAVIDTEDGFEVRFEPREQHEPPATITDDTWPHHVDGTRKKIGEMTTQQQVAVAAGAVARVAGEFAAQGVTVEFKGKLPADVALDGIPEFCKIPQEKRKESWIKNPPKVAAANLKEAITMAKSKAKEKKPRGAKGADKTATLLSMLKGKGSTVEQLAKALDWLPHTLRARLSRVAKPKTKGGEGLKLERERVDGVTTYRLA